jgi:hypothetical protein
VLALLTPLSLTAGWQDDDGAGSRHICPKEALRNGTCDPNPNRPKTSSGTAQRKDPRYKRVAKQGSTNVNCNVRVQETQNAKSKNKCAVRLSPSVPDLPLTSQKIGVTIWRVREARQGYEGARILSHPSARKAAPAYQAERIEGQPVLSYGDLVRMSVESPRNGFLYVFNRELYHDGSLSNPYMIFPTTRLRRGDNKILANRPIEIPSRSDDPFYFEAKRAGLDSSKKLVGEILSVVITDKPISAVGVIGSDVKELSDDVMMAIEDKYAGRAEVFELEEGVGLPYSIAEHAAADDAHARLLTHKDPVPQTLYLVEEKRNGGLLVTVALSYRG